MARRSRSLGPYRVYCRPGLDAFLVRCHECFNVTIWTSSASGYADGGVSQLFPNPADLTFVWTRSRYVRRFHPEFQSHY